MPCINPALRNIDIHIVGSGDSVRDVTASAIVDTPGFTLLGTYDVAEFMTLTVGLSLPDVLLIYVEPDGMASLTWVIRLKKQHPELNVIFLTHSEDEAEMLQCLRAGASGYLWRGIPSMALLSSIRDVVAGGSALSAPMTRKLVLFIAQSPPSELVIPGLSSQEQKVLELLSQGLRYKEIAQQIGVGVATVRTYLERGYQKLGVTNRTEAVTKFLQHRR